MKIKELIKELEKLPQEATIGTFDLDNTYISGDVEIYKDKNEHFYPDWALEKGVTIKKIEDSRKSNKGKECDYYIGY